MGIYLLSRYNEVVGELSHNAAKILGLRSRFRISASMPNVSRLVLGPNLRGPPATRGSQVARAANELRAMSLPFWAIKLPGKPPYPILSLFSPHARSSDHFLACSTPRFMQDGDGPYGEGASFHMAVIMFERSSPSPHLCHRRGSKYISPGWQQCLGNSGPYSF